MRTVVTAFLTASLIWLVKPLPGAEPGQGPPRVYQLAEAASVGLLVDGHYGGSGTFIDREGLVISALHILARPGRKVEVVSPTVGRLVAKTVAVDMGHDLVLLRVPARAGGYPTLPLATHMPPAGETVFHFGSPVYRHNLIQRGMMARKGLTYEHQGHFIEVMQIAANVQEGTSGGPWLNQAGQKPDLVALEPLQSPFLTTGQGGAHRIEGIGLGFTPPFLNLDRCDEIRAIDENEAIEMCKRLAVEEGIFCGPSTGLNVTAALEIAAERGPDSVVVTLGCDHGSKYTN